MAQLTSVRDFSTFKSCTVYIQRNIKSILNLRKYQTISFKNHPDLDSKSHSLTSSIKTT